MRIYMNMRIYEKIHKCMLTGFWQNLIKATLPYLYNTQIWKQVIPIYIIMTYTSIR